MSLIAELRRRNVVRVASLYLVGGWLLVQVAGTVLPMFEAPAWLARAIVVALVAGFVPAMVVSWLFEWTPEGWKRDQDAAAAQPVAAGAARRLDRTIMLVLALALAYFGFDRFVFLPQRQATIIQAATRSGAEQAVAEAKQADAPRSIAVLPFEDRSGDPSQEYFADGLTDELTTALARIAALKVIARASAAHYRGTEKTPAEIGSELGVGALVTGAVLRAGGRVRYTAELVATRSQTSLWAESYEREERDVLALQSEVASAIADAIEVRLSPGESERLASVGSVDPKALEEYLRGRALWHRRSEQAVRGALAHFERATQIAPGFALGHAGMADSYIILGVWAYAPPREVFPAAKAAALRAIALDPGAGEPHASLGDILFHYDWDFAAAEREHRLAIELAPGFATAFHWGSEALLLSGNVEGALARARRARALDPLSMTIRASLAQTLGIAGRNEDAIVELNDALALEPAAVRTRRELARLLLATGRREAALAEARRLVALDPEFLQGLATLGLCLAATGRIDEARTLLAQLETQVENSGRFTSSLELARISAGLADADTTLRLLEQAVAAREGFLPFLEYDQEFHFLRGNPRFDAILREIGISATLGANQRPLALR